MIKNIFTSIACVVSLSLSAQEMDLSQYERSIYSSAGEDGVLAKIFELIPPSSFFCVELGAGDGFSDSNTYLLGLQKWNRLLFDRAHEDLNSNLAKEFITAENINQLLDKHAGLRAVDFLCINIRYNNYYFWKAIDSSYLPNVVMVRYNSSHLPSEDKVVKYRPYFAGDQTNYYGASILAMQKLGESKGYSLVYAEKSGSYLFFIRDEIIKERELEFKNVNNVEKLYPLGQGSIPEYNDPKGREWFSSIQVSSNGS